MRELLPLPPPSPNKPLVLGLLGGIASGKSTLARALQAKGFLLIDADQIAKDLLKDPHILEALRKHFGPKIFHSEAQIDRSKLAKLVFTQEKERKFLEKLLHPKVRKRVLEELDRASSKHQAAVLDAPLLLEGGLYLLCDLRVFVHVSAEERQKRAAARGMDLIDWKARETIQASLEEKRKVAHFEITNEGQEQHTLEEVYALVNRLQNLGFI
jgi:dephospho-CoA kinase